MHQLHSTTFQRWTGSFCSLLETINIFPVCSVFLLPSNKKNNNATVFSCVILIDNNFLFVFTLYCPQWSCVLSHCVYLPVPLHWASGPLCNFWARLLFFMSFDDLWTGSQLICQQSHHIKKGMVLLFASLLLRLYSRVGPYTKALQCLCVFQRVFRGLCVWKPGLTSGGSGPICLLAKNK